MTFDNEVIKEIVYLVVKLILRVMFIMALIGKPVTEFLDDFSTVFLKLICIRITLIAC